MDKRTPGIFKIEWKGTEMICLNSKTYLFFFQFRRKLINFSEMANNEWTQPTRKNTTVPLTVFRKEKKRTRQAIIGLGKHLNIIQPEVKYSPIASLY